MNKILIIVFFFFSFFSFGQNKHKLFVTNLVKNDVFDYFDKFYMENLFNKILILEKNVEILVYVPVAKEHYTVFIKQKKRRGGNIGVLVKKDTTYIFNVSCKCLNRFFLNKRLREKVKKEGEMMEGHTYDMNYTSIYYTDNQKYHRTCIYGEEDYVRQDYKIYKNAYKGRRHVYRLKKCIHRIIEKID